MEALGVIVFLSSIFILVYLRAPAIIWIVAVGLILIVLSLFHPANIIFLFISWILYLFAVAFVQLKNFRRKYFSKPFIEYLQKRIPVINESEKVAIEAGDVWWEKELFCGRPKWKDLLSNPKSELSSVEQSFLDNEVESLCGILNNWQTIHVEQDLSKEAWAFLKKHKFMGLIIPKEYDGLGFSALAHSTIVTKIATKCSSCAVNTMVPNSLGPAELIHNYGTKEQKNYYLPRLAKGEEIPAFGLTSPNAGSDAGSITDSGIVCYGDHEGKKVLGIRLNWDKRYITLAPIATVIGIAFKMFDPDGLLGDKKNIGITLVLVPTDHPGVETGLRHIPLYVAFMNGPTRGTDVFVPLDWIIGGIKMAGEGWRMMMESLSVGRSISLPALSTAAAKVAYVSTSGYSRLRKQFNVSICKFEGIEEALGDIAGLTYMLEACRTMTASAVDLNIRPSIVSAIVKYHMTETARLILSRAMDIQAGYGIQLGPRNILGTTYLAAPVSITVEGANILTRNLIIFGQGAIRCHPYLLDEVNLFSSEDGEKKIKELDKLLLSHIGYTLSNLFRSFWLGITGGYLSLSPVSGPTAKHYKQLNRMSSALALLSDFCMLIFGGSLKRKERVSARLGDVLSQLYLSSCVLKYYQDSEVSQDETNYVSWCIDYSLNKMQIALDDLLYNFPLTWFGKLFRFIIFPWGVAYKKPKDILTNKIVKSMLDPSDIREKLKKFCYVGDESEPLCKIEKGFSMIQKIDPIFKKFQLAVKKRSFACLWFIRY
ncbi:acyl-CoA dehydrogenase [Gammaproteobacteria bacterium]|nr:acyl-CoA dehydrogenase [Gammaproteobacteria bacterium]